MNRVENNMENKPYPWKGKLKSIPAADKKVPVSNILYIRLQLKRAGRISKVNSVNKQRVSHPPNAKWE
jgi:hypothetical protein